MRRESAHYKAHWPPSRWDDAKDSKRPERLFLNPESPKDGLDDVNGNLCGWLVATDGVCRAILTPRFERLEQDYVATALTRLDYPQTPKSVEQLLATEGFDPHLPRSLCRR